MYSFTSVIYVCSLILVVVVHGLSVAEKETELVFKIPVSTHDSSLEKFFGYVEPSVIFQKHSPGKYVNCYLKLPS